MKCLFWSYNYNVLYCIFAWCCIHKLNCFIYIVSQIISICGGGEEGRMGVCVFLCLLLCFMLFVLCIYYVAIVLKYLFSAYVLHYVFFMYVFVYDLCVYACLFFFCFFFYVINQSLGGYTLLTLKKYIKKTKFIFFYEYY